MYYIKMRYFHKSIENFSKNYIWSGDSSRCGTGIFTKERLAHSDFQRTGVSSKTHSITYCLGLMETQSQKLLKNIIFY